MTMAVPPPPPASAPPQIPHPLPPTLHWENFDDKPVYDKVRVRATAADARNFVVEFGAKVSRIALDLTTLQVQELLAQPRDDKLPIRWINTWNSSSTGEDKEALCIIETIGRHYGFSTRLIETIKTWDTIKPQVRDIRMKRDNEKKSQHEKQNHKGKAKRQTDNAWPNLEANGISLRHLPSGRDHSTTSHHKRGPIFAAPLLNSYKLTHDTLNYTTIDQVADKFICVGANWLHRGPAEERRSSSLIPPWHWAWYALCSDKNCSDKNCSDKTSSERTWSSPDTVLTFHEAPYFAGEEDKEKTEELKHMRANTLKVLCQLSKEGETEYRENFFEITAVRRPLRDNSGARTASPSPSPSSGPAALNRSDTAYTFPVGPPRYLEASSNLFYYLFEDYTAIIPILSEAQDSLESLAYRVLDTTRRGYGDTADIIPKLYKIGKELRQLQHLFESYKTLIQRILAYAEAHATPHHPGDKLALSARDRFERLKDRLQLLMLNTIEEHLQERSSLSDTYFNLTAQKDSQATARLTRSATLLAKLSVFFLPISFITSFFSIQLPDVLAGYDKYTYWGAFGVTAFISFLSLFFFGRLLMVVSDTLESISSRAWKKAKASCRGIRKRIGFAADDEDGLEDDETLVGQSKSDSNE